MATAAAEPTGTLARTTKDSRWSWIAGHRIHIPDPTFLD